MPKKKVEAIESPSRKKRDSRTHDQRVADLEKAFLALKEKAIASGKSNDASAAKVLEAANVNRTYFYIKDKLKDANTLSKYHAVRDKIQAFQDSFDEYNSDSIVNKLQARLNKSEAQRIGIQQKLEEQQALVTNLQNDKNALKQKVRNQNDQMIDYQHAATVRSRPEGGVFSEAIIIEPDKYLWRNGEYLFHDETVRKKAWEQAKEELIRAIRRPLPMRVYVLVGAPCSGKSTWANDNKNFYPDLHSVIIDATNLTYVNRLEWMSLINKYRLNVHKLCAAVFLTPTPVLQSRNNRREPTKKMDNDVLLKKVKDLEFPDLAFEDFDELIVVRGSHE